MYMYTAEEVTDTENDNHSFSGDISLQWASSPNEFS